MFCPKCGAQLKDDAKFCNKCGAQLQPSPRQQAYNQQSAALQPPVKKKKTLWVVLILLILLLAAAGGVFAAYRMGVLDPFLPSSSQERESNKGSKDKDDEDDNEDDKDSKKKSIDEEEDEKESDEDSEEESSRNGKEKDDGDSEDEKKEESASRRPAIADASTAAEEPATTTAAALPVTATAKYASQVNFSGLYKAGYVRDTAYGSSNVVQKDSKIDNSAWSAFDGDVITSWQEGREGDGIGEFIGIGLDRTYQVKVITVTLGNHRTAELYVKNNVPRTLTFQIGGQDFQATFPNEMQEFALEFSQPVEASELRITVNDVYKGTVYADASIAEVEVYGY